MTQPDKKVWGAELLTSAELNANFNFVEMIARNPNVLINPDFVIAQRGTSFAAIAAGDYHLDRWGYNKSGTMVHTVSQDSDIPTQAEADDTAAFSMLTDCTTADASIAAGDFALQTQLVLGYNTKPLLNRKCTLSFWVKATKTGIYCVAFQNSGEDRSYVIEYTITDSDTWERKEVTLTMHDGASGTWDFTTGTGLRVIFTLAAGSTFQTTPDAWQTGNFYGTSNQVNACDNVANDFRIAMTQLEVGNDASPLDRRFFAIEKLLAKAYFHRVTSSGVLLIGSGLTPTSSTLNLSYFFAESMRIAPSIAISALADFTIAHGALSAVVDGSLIIQRADLDRAQLVASVTGSPLTSGEAGYLIINAADKWIEFDAELAI